jgi:hypothetical protein
MTMVQGGMPRPPSSNDVQVAIRLPAEWLARADALLPTLGPPGVTLTRSDALRAALARGLDALEADRDAKPPKGGRK